LIEYTNGQVQNDYLYRVAVPGQPQLNQMQTNLDMGNNNINNAQNVNVNQDVTLGNPGPAGGGYAATSPGQLGVDEPAGQGFPNGWGGGIHTWDLYANGTVATGENGSTNAYMSDFDGGIGGGGQVVTSSPNGANYTYMQSSNNGSSIVTNGTVQGGAVNSTGNMYAAGQVTAQNLYAYNQTSSQTFSAYQNGNSYWDAFSNGNTNQTGNADVGGQVRAGYDATLGTAGGSANVGWGCSPNGAIAANANGSGQVLACEGGTWQVMGGGVGPVHTFGFPNGFNGSVGLGTWHYCSLMGYGQYNNSYYQVGISGGPYANGTYSWVFSGSGFDNNVLVGCF
ncbi:MAG: shufflon system plasmid conjugative transfer pilus tip adhesin PilV, partial [Acidithiobacillus sp.]|nr:shufflon system plasmid conjugative transfer pilus tip adhesin PilV [Acidithiobacillus sp.]